MGPIERGLTSVIDLLHEGNYSPIGGRPIPIERIYEANTITHDQYLAILKEMEEEKRSNSHARMMNDMGAESDLLADRLRKSGFPARFVNASVDKTHQFELASGRWIYVQGQDVETVTRKATSIAKGWLSDNSFGTLRFVRSTTMSSEVIGSGVQDFMQMASSVGLLVLSGVGSENATSWMTSKMSELFDIRYGNGLPTILTTRHQPDELALHLGERSDNESVRGIIDLLRRQSVMVRV